MLNLWESFYIFHCIDIIHEVWIKWKCSSDLSRIESFHCKYTRWNSCAPIVRKFLYLPLHWYFLCDLICYYPWSLDLIKWTRNKLNKQDNEDSDTQVSSLFFLVVFWCWFYFFWCLLPFWRLYEFLKTPEWLDNSEARRSRWYHYCWLFSYFSFFPCSIELKIVPGNHSKSLPDFI